MYALTFYYGHDPKNGATYIHETLQDAQEEMRATYRETLQDAIADKHSVINANIGEWDANLIIDEGTDEIYQMLICITCIYE